MYNWIDQWYGGSYDFTYWELFAAAMPFLYWIYLPFLAPYTWFEFAIQAWGGYNAASYGPGTPAGEFYLSLYYFLQYIFGQGSVTAHNQ